MLRKNIIGINLNKRNYYIYTNTNKYNKEKIIPQPHPNYMDNAWEAIDG